LSPSERACARSRRRSAFCSSERYAEGLAVAMRNPLDRVLCRRIGDFARFANRGFELLAQRSAAQR
jgi:hypothetical protein